MTNIDLKPLLDNLRNATEFWNAVKESGPNQDTIADGSFSDAREWLTAAALDLGRALVAQREAVTQEDSVDGRPLAIECPACGEQELMPGDLCACGYQLPGSGEVKSVELKNPKAPATATGEHVDRHLYASRGEAEQAAKARLASFSRSSASVRLELPGRGDLFAERSLLLQGFKAGIDGEFLIDSVEHTYSSSGWTTVVQCNGGRGGKG